MTASNDAPSDGAASAPVFSIADVIDGGRWTTAQKGVVVLAALAFAIEGMAGQVMGPVIPALIRAWHVHKTSFAPVTALGLVGFILGASAGGLVGDRIGRRPTLIASLAIMGLTTLGCVWTSSPGALGVWRLFAGLGLGASIPIATALLTEFTPARRRSLALACAVTFLPLGGSVTGALAAWILPRAGWQALFLAVAAAAILFALLFLAVLPESPRWIGRRRGAAAARLGLERIGLAFDPRAELASEEAALPAAKADVLSPELRGDTAWLWSAFFFLVLAMYVVFSWLPTALTSGGLTLALAASASSAFSLGGVAGNLLTGWLTDQFGSRVSLAILGLLGAVAAGLLSVLQSAGGGMASPGLMALLFALGAGVSGLQTALYVVASAVYPPAARATGLGAAVAVGRVGALLSAYAGVFLIDHGGARSYFGGVFAALVAAGICSLAIRRQARSGADRLDVLSARATPARP